MTDSSIWLVYMVRCKDRTLYCGMTNNLAKRLAAHNAGTGAKYTRGRGPVELVYIKHVEDRSAALKFEARVKKLSRAAKEVLVESMELGPKNLMMLINAGASDVE